MPDHEERAAAAALSGLGPAARRLGALAALAGFVAVAAGAFGAHALRAHLPAELLAVFQTGVQYQGLHAVALLGCALAVDRLPGRLVHVAGGCFIAGIVLFSGSLYVLALTGVRAWGAVTPVGGVALLAGWVALAAAMLRPGR